MAAAESQPVKTKKRRASMCVGCGGQITDQYILRVAPDLEWHASCLKCTDCSVYLDETCTCFVRDGKTYCKRDYVRLFGTKCARCGQGFSKTDFVMRAKNKIYHINCFRCVACSRELIPGDEFALRDDGLFCKADHDIVESASSGSRTPTGGLLEDSKLNILNNNNNDTKNGMHPTGSESSPPASGSSGGGSKPHGHGNRGSRHKSDQKTTRIRTVLNEKQLHTLRTCYSANPRPDALMKEQLVEMTGLSPRVIRVWFQNKRCKDKKKSILMKQMQQQQQDKGVPMVASSPVRHEPPPNMQPAPVEVQQYQAPWKALTEFAMQSDLDQPPFQQLVSTCTASSSDNDDDDDIVISLAELSPGGCGGAAESGAGCDPIPSDTPRTALGSDPGGYDGESECFVDLHGRHALHPDLLRVPPGMRRPPFLGLPVVNGYLPGNGGAPEGGALSSQADGGLPAHLHRPLHNLHRPPHHLYPMTAHGAAAQHMGPLPTPLPMGPMTPLMPHS